MVIKHVKVSEKDKKPTIRHNEIKEFVEDKTSTISLLYNYDDKDYEIKYNKTRKGETWYAETKLPIDSLMPKVGEPTFLEVKQIKTL